jgi:hypothetical protein
MYIPGIVTGVTHPFAGLELCRGPFPMGVGRSPPLSLES